LVEAGALYRLVLGADPRQPDALHLLGLIRFHQGEGAAAVGLIEHSLIVNSQHLQAHHNLGNIHRDLGRMEEAARSYREATRVAPDFAPAWNGLGRALAALGRGDEAEAALVRGVAKDPNDADPVFLLARVRFSLGRTEAATVAFRRALTLAPAVDVVWLGEARALMAGNRLAEAQTAVARCLRLSPRNSDALLERARLLEALRVWDEAADALAAVAEQRPGDASLFLRRAQAAHNANHDEEALAAARVAAGGADDAQAAIASLLMGTIIRDTGGDLSEAVDCFERAVARHPPQSMAHFHLGVTRLLTGASADEAFVDREGFAPAHTEYAHRLVAENRLKDACAHFHEALLFNARFAPARDGLYAALDLRLERCRYGEMPDREHTVEWGDIALYHAMDKYNRAVVANPRLLGVPEISTGASPRPRVFDCFTFYNELDLLEARLEELWDEVDAFVAVEATRTFQGKPKPLILRDHFDRFRRFADKLVVVSLDEPDAGPSPWDREGAQRDAISRGLAGRAAPHDVIFLGDIDEIPRRGVVAAIRDNPRWAGRLNRLSADYHCGFIDFKCNYRWHKQVALPYALLSEIGPDHTRFLAIAKYGTLFYNAGWHFSWLGGIERVIDKLKAYAHSEHTGLARQGDDVVRRALRSGRGIFALMEEDQIYGGEFSVVPLDDGFPEVIRRDPEKYRRLGWFYPTE